jgi:probable F420-dependent oxidoreductase
MKVGITIPNLGPQATRENVLETAIQAEKEGFDSVWTITRILWPLKPQSPYYGTPDGLLPIEYQNALDPLDVLLYVAANTSNIKLGTAVIDMFYYTPIMLAKRLATLDVLSQGRAICGLGLGWSKDEYQASNIPFKDRGERAEEFIQILKKIWNDDIVEFKGKYYNIPASKIGPKPFQKPHIPIYLGGNSSNTFSRIVKQDLNGWLGVSRSILYIGGLAQVENGKNAIKQYADQMNRDSKNLSTILVTYPNVENQSPTNDRNRFPLTGTIDEIGRDIQQIKGMGVDHIVFGYNFVPIGRDVSKMISLSKELSKYAR